MFKHPQQGADHAIKGRDPALLRTLHIWLTSAAFEIIDNTVPRLIDPSVRTSDDRTLAFYFASPAPGDPIVYHPTSIIDDKEMTIHERAQRSPWKVHSLDKVGSRLE